MAAVPEHVLTAQVVTVQAPVLTTTHRSYVMFSSLCTSHLTVRLIAEVDLAHVAGEVGGPEPAVSALLVNPGAEVDTGVTDQGVG